MSHWCGCGYTEQKKRGRKRKSAESANLTKEHAISEAEKSEESAVPELKKDEVEVAAKEDVEEDLKEDPKDKEEEDATTDAPSQVCVPMLHRCKVRFFLRLVRRTLKSESKLRQYIWRRISQFEVELAVFGNLDQFSLSESDCNVDCRT